MVQAPTDFRNAWLSVLFRVVSSSKFLAGPKMTSP